MSTQLKAGVGSGPSGARNADVAEVVSEVLEEVRAHGDVAVRRYSEKFDQWSPESLPARQRPDRRARRVVAGPGGRGHPDGAGQRARLRPAPARHDAGPRGRDPARRGARPQAPADRGVGGLRAGRPLPADRVGAHDGRDRQGRRRRAGDRVHPTAARGDPRGHRGGPPPRRRRRDLPARRGAGRRRDGDRHREHRPGRPDRGPGQRLRRGGQAPAVRRGRHRPLRRSDRDPRGGRRRGRPVRGRRRPAQPGRARPRLPGRPDHHLGAGGSRGHAPHRGDPARHADQRHGRPRLARPRRGARRPRPRRGVRPGRHASPASTCRS